MVKIRVIEVENRIVDCCFIVQTKKSFFAPWENYDRFSTAKEAITYAEKLKQKLKRNNPEYPIIHWESE